MRLNRRIAQLLPVCIAPVCVALSACPGRPALAAAAQDPVPVTLATATKGTTEVELSGLGTVQAWRSVTARAQVNGYLAGIAFHEGQTVKAGDLLASIDPRPYAAILAQAMAKKATDQANLTNDRLNYGRDTTLAAKGFQTVQQADNDLALVREYGATLQGDDAAIAAAQLNLDFCSIRAPMDGVVGFRLVDVGNLIEASAETAIVSIQQIQPIAVVFTLPEAQFEDVAQALRHGALTALAYAPDDTTLLDSGTLVASDNQIATTTGTISLKAIFQNKDRRLWPGQSVQARLRLRSEPGIISVADGVIQHGPDGLYVYTVSPDMTVHQQTVTVGYDNGGRSTITNGLQDGQRIVAAGQSRLQEGTRVRPAATAAVKS